MVLKKQEGLPRAQEALPAKLMPSLELVVCSCGWPPTPVGPPACVGVCFPWSLRSPATCPQHGRPEAEQATRLGCDGSGAARDQSLSYLVFLSPKVWVCFDFTFTY